MGHGPASGRNASAMAATLDSKTSMIYITYSHLHDKYIQCNTTKINT